MQVIAVQPGIAWEDKPATHAHVLELLSAAQPEPGGLMVLPEMFATGFSLNVPVIAEQGAAGETEGFLRELARQFGCAVLAGVVRSAPDGRGLNQAVCFAPDGAELCRYTKLHPFSFASEQETFAPGEGVRVFQWQGVSIAPLVCYDLRFPEAFRHAAVAGAQVLAVIANWPTQRVSHWRALLPARAIENQAVVVGVNRAGSDPKLSYPGQSMIIDERGQTLALAGDQPQVIAATLDLEAQRQYRAKFPALRDVRRELLGLS